MNVVDYLKSLRHMRAQVVCPADWTYSGPEDFILQHGRAFNAPACQITHDTMMRSHNVKRGPIKQCFRNAGQYWHNERVTYVEGYASSVIPVLHAWLVTDDGQVIDPTFPNIGTEYFGVAFRGAWLRQYVMESKFWGVLGGDWVPDCVMQGRADCGIVDKSFFDGVKEK